MDLGDPKTIRDAIVIAISMPTCTAKNGIDEHLHSLIRDVVLKKSQQIFEESKSMEARNAIVQLFYSLFDKVQF